MRKKIVITDLTRMNQGRVCIAGYDENGTCIRPVLPPPGIQEQALYQESQPTIFPFAIVEFDFLEPNPQPPHTEDVFYNESTVRLVGRLNEEQRRNLLEKTACRSLKEIFDAPIHTDPGHYVMKGQGTRSLGTLQPKQIELQIQSRNEAPEYRLKFTDESGTYCLKITDLTWLYYCNDQRRKGEPGFFSKLTIHLNQSITYLRVGLTRPTWEKYPDKCFIQINGVYTFPDYLEGKIFADFAPQPKG